jgi:hypothetical protein
MTESHNTTSSAESVSCDWEARSAAYDLLKAEIQPSNKTALFDALAAAGITHVFVHFDGYGDSGQIESVEAQADGSTVAMPKAKVEIARAEWGQAEPEHSTVTVADAVEQLAYDFLTDKHDGWENDDGAYGDFTFDVAARTITLDYNERFVDSTHSQHVF